MFIVHEAPLEDNKVCGQPETAVSQPDIVNPRIDTETMETFGK